MHSGTEVGLEPLLTWFCWLYFVRLLAVWHSTQALWNECDCVLITCVALSHLTSLCLSFLLRKMEVIISHMITGLEALKSC